MTTIYMAPRPPRSRGMVTPVSDLKRRTVARFPYTDEAIDRLYSTNVRYEHVVPQEDYVGYYDSLNRWKNDVREFFGGSRNQPDMVVYRGDPAWGERYSAPITLGHEYLHYRQGSDDSGMDQYAWSGDPIVEKSWKEYNHEEALKKIEKWDVVRPGTPTKYKESHAVTGSEKHLELTPEQRGEWYPNLFDEQRVRRDQADEYDLVVVNPANVKQTAPVNKYGQTQGEERDFWEDPDRGRQAWGGPISRKGEY